MFKNEALYLECVTFMLSGLKLLAEIAASRDQSFAEATKQYASQI